jgi:hypothetical protein
MRHFNEELSSFHIADSNTKQSVARKGTRSCVSMAAMNSYDISRDFARAIENNSNLKLC